MTELHFAPLQGYADHHYRRLHASIFGGIDCYYTPFIRVEKGQPRHQDMARLRASAADGTKLVPQVIFSSADELSILVEAVKSLGFNRIDLNLGCPYPMQTGKGRGAAMIGRLDVMREVARMVEADASVAYSVKMRLGVSDAAQWRQLMPILGSMRLAHVAVHPRIARQMYAGELYMEQMREFVAVCPAPVIYNGELRTPEDIDRIVAEFPTLRGVMIGRGLLARPSLAAEWRSGHPWSREQRMEGIISMHDALLRSYQDTLCGQTQILQKIKPFWEYLDAEIGHKAYKAIRKATTLDRYHSALRSLC